MLTRHGAGAFAVLALMAVLPIATACGNNTGKGQDEIELGGQLYLGNCAVCHGQRGQGNPAWRTKGPDGRYPPPPHDSTGHTWHHSDGLLFRIAKHGGASLNILNFQSGMPAFEGVLKDSEIKAVILYLKTLWGPEERQFQAEQSARDPLP